MYLVQDMLHLTAVISSAGACAIDLCIMHTGGVSDHNIQSWLRILRGNFALSISIGENVTGECG